MICLLIIGSLSFAESGTTIQDVNFENQLELNADRIWVTGIASPWTYYLTMIPSQKSHTVVYNGYLYSGTLNAYQDEFRGWTEWRRLYQGYLYNTGVMPARVTE